MNGYSLLLAATFDRTSIAAVRHQLRDAAGRCRMSGERRDDFVLAVNEIMANAVRHGGGTGLLRLWCDGDLRCEVTDQGSGFDAGTYLRRDRPQPSPSGGMGLWIAQQTSNDLTIDSGPAGTTIGIRSNLDPQS
jgi:anti-sigma regulatory factor (Ser/Thr protein kinase)